MFRKRSTLYRSGSKKGVSFARKSSAKHDPDSNPYRKHIFISFKILAFQYLQNSKKSKEVQRIMKNEKSFVMVCKGDGVADHRLSSMEDYVKYNFTSDVSPDDYILRKYILQFSNYFQGVSNYVLKQDTRFVKVDKFMKDYSEVPEIIIEAYVKSCSGYCGGSTLDKHQFPLRTLRVLVKDEVDEKCVFRVIKVLKMHYVTKDLFTKWEQLRNIFTLERVKDLFLEQRLVKFKKKLPFEDAIDSLGKLRNTRKIAFKMMDVLMETYDRIFESAIRRKIDHVNDTDLSLIIAYVMLNVDIYKFPAWVYYINSGIRDNDNLQTTKEKTTALFHRIVQWLLKDVDITINMEGYVPKKSECMTVSEMLDAEASKKADIPQTRKKIMMMMMTMNDHDQQPPPEEEEEEQEDDDEQEQEEEGEIKLELEQEDGGEVRKPKELTFDELQKLKKEELELERRRQEEALLLEQQKVREKKDLNYKISKTFAGQHTGSLTSILYFNSVKKLVSSSVDNTIRVWEMSTGECLRTIHMKDEIVLECDDDGDNGKEDLTGVILPEPQPEEKQKIITSDSDDILQHPRHLIKFDEETFLCCSVSENDRKNVKAFSVIPPDFVKLKEFKSPKLCPVYRLLKLRQRDLFMIMTEGNELYVMSYSQCRVLRKLSNEKVSMHSQLKNSLRIKSGFYINCSRVDKNKVKLINHEENKVIKSFSKHKKYEIFGITPFLNSENEECIIACGTLESFVDSSSPHLSGGENQQEQQSKSKKSLPEAYYLFIYNTTHSKLGVFKNPLIKKLKVFNGGGNSALFCFGSSTRLNDRNYAFLGTHHGTLDIYDITNLNVKMEENEGGGRRMDSFKIHHDRIEDMVFIDFDNYEKNSYDPILTLATCSGGEKDTAIRIVQVRGVKYFLDGGKNTNFVTVTGDYTQDSEEEEEEETRKKYIATPHKDDSEEMYLMKRNIRVTDQEIQATMFKLAQKDKRIRELKLQVVRIVQLCDKVLDV